MAPIEHCADDEHCHLQLSDSPASQTLNQRKELSRVINVAHARGGGSSHVRCSCISRVDSHDNNRCFCSALASHFFHTPFALVG